MIWFLVAAAVLTAIVLTTLLAPMVRPGGDSDREEPVSEIFRRQLATLDEELTEGRISTEEAEAARTEITRRLIAAARRAPQGSALPVYGARDMPRRFGAAVAIAAVLPSAALAIYFAVGTPAAIERDAVNAAEPHDTAELAAAAEQIKAHLKEAPNDLKGWTLLARSLASLGRFPEALDAYNHAVALAPGEPGLHAELGEVMVLAAHGVVTPEAEAEFAKVPADPRSRYYPAEAALQRGDPAAARQKLQALLASAPADAPWRQTVADRLAELSQSGGGPSSAADAPATNAAIPGPTARDMAAAQSMTPQAREAMIRGMVERLAQRLERNPGDKAGWERLARAYDVLGEPEKAQAARVRAAAGAGTPASTSAGAAASPTAGASPPAAELGAGPRSAVAPDAPRSAAGAS